MQKQQHFSNSKPPLILLLVFMIIYGALSVHIGQDVNWDLRNYHFYDAYAFFHHRMGLDIAPAMLQTYFSPTMDLLNYFLITTQRPIVTGFLLGTISGISAFVLYQSALILFSDIDGKWKNIYAIFAIIIGTTGWAGMNEIGSTTNETKTALLVILAFYFVLRTIGHPSPKKNITFAGLIIGVAVGLKLTAAIYELGILIGILCSCGINRRQFLLGALFVLTSFIGFFAADGYWLIIMYQHFHNPLFPFYNNIFHSPYLPFLDYADHHFRPTDWEHYIFLPFYLIRHSILVNEVPMRDPRLAVVYVLSILFILKKIFIAQPEDKLSPTWRFMFITFLVSYVAWLIQFTIYRYVIPLEFFSGLAVVYYLQCLIKKRIWQIILLLVIARYAIHFTTYAGYNGRIKFGQTYFSVPAPELPNHSMVLLTNEPLAFVIPFFHSTSPIRFIGIDNNLIEPTNPTAFQKIVKQTVNAHQGPLFSLTYQQFNDEAKNGLSYYDLTQIASQCQIIETNIGGNKLILCPVKRK